MQSVVLEYDGSGSEYENGDLLLKPARVEVFPQGVSLAFPDQFDADARVTLRMSQAEGRALVIRLRHALGV